MMARQPYPNRVQEALSIGFFSFILLKKICKIMHSYRKCKASKNSFSRLISNAFLVFRALIEPGTAACASADKDCILLEYNLNALFSSHSPAYY